jgi:hypothetical protein
MAEKIYIAQKKVVLDCGVILKFKIINLFEKFFVLDIIYENKRAKTS